MRVTIREGVESGRQDSRAANKAGARFEPIHTGPVKPCNTCRVCYPLLVRFYQESVVCVRAWVLYIVLSILDELINATCLPPPPPPPLPVFFQPFSLVIEFSSRGCLRSVSYIYIYLYLPFVSHIFSSWRPAAYSTVPDSFFVTTFISTGSERRGGK